MYDIDIYTTASGKEPYTEWILSLDRLIRARINSRFARIRDSGNLGDYKPIGEGVFELKFDFGPGYRIYFGLEQNKIVVLLLGGNKGQQQKDINKAIKYWTDYLSSKEGKNDTLQKLQRIFN